MEAELTTHLGYEKHDPAGYGSGNSRNGKSKKRLKGDFAKSRSKYRATVRQASSRGSCPKETRASPVSTTSSCQCMHAG